MSCTHNEVVLNDNIVFRGGDSLQPQYPALDDCLIGLHVRVIGTHRAGAQAGSQCASQRGGRTISDKLTDISKSGGTTHDFFAFDFPAAGFFVSFGILASSLLTRICYREEMSVAVERNWSFNHEILAECAGAKPQCASVTWH